MVDIVNNLKLAVLIDADNATASVCKDLRRLDHSKPENMEGSITHACYSACAAI